MSTTTRLVDATPEQVWEILADGWLYPLWVVGTSRMREVDESWPAPGSKLYHSVGSWPLLVDDTTEVVEMEPERSLRLRVRAWPGGEAEVVLGLRALGDACEIVMAERPVRGPAAALPRPLTEPLLRRRNAECLRRLAHIAERRP